MKKLLNSLYLSKQGCYLHIERETIVIEYEKTKLAQFPIHAIGGIFCFGNILVSPYVYRICGEYGVALSFFSEYGDFFARMQTRQTGNILLRRAQYKVSETNPVLIARNIAAAKISASRRVLQRQIRNRGDDPDLENAVNLLKLSVLRLAEVKELDVVRGIEGEAALRYFEVFNNLITNKEFVFNGRNRRPPIDPVNAMLSFVYAIIGRDIAAALQGVGLDPQAGFLHADRSGRDSLALDILEEFRAWFADRLVLSLINRKQVKLSDFTVEASGAVRLSDEARKLLLNSIQERKQENIIHPFIAEETPVGLLPHLQAQLLARHIRGDIKEYPPFLAR
ncbi:MAG: type I-C CRISPR-associated endonuclease Cas1c [Deferribacteraceae bacterium]|jgi:CRISPR-associated protein Cas1|nr:type I-C CRISPR-associated endonuclease Cas1c [Deferribacteraceae bacterium]